ncbi:MULTISPECIES: hypothetical protein [Francisella]|uniref:Uncharacterized protein n=1 Tax=Francisella opportunistica TaxID=2016517 RepID=A0A345JTJ6_9GAMM|nr:MULTISPECIES: hypothetical protein [Francisella]APC92441.1 hypothetical protein BBG19_1717 [Francisella sp. MA067296]AXH30642.1 hypothetical protein CGC43_08700 [Francisella opportunistica]AXH32282.1 hypothetical protein CGC44_08670 [Francisella opportunistica]AXH33931.1 hypothetical protein CGC45_08730 [Francisella opportunistica]
MISFPRNYKNCIRYINEYYPNHSKRWHANWKQDNAVYIIKGIIVEEKIINIWINIWLLKKDPKNLAILKSCLDIAATPSLKSQILEKWLTLYNYVLYPELLTYQKHIYRNGEIFFSKEDYNNKSLSAIEQFIRQALGKYRVSVDLEFVNQTIGSILGVAKLNQPLSKVYTQRLTTISGKIIFRMLIQESREKFRQIYDEVTEKLTNLTFELDVFFKDILVVIDNGLETLNLGDILSKKSLSGNFAYKVIKNEKY